MAGPLTRDNPLRSLALFLAALAGLLFAPAPARAASPSVIGARTFDRGGMGVWASAGVPDVEFGARWGLSSAVDLGPRLRLSYGTGSHIGGFGSSAALLVRMRIATLQGWDLALTAEPGAFVHTGVQDWAPLAKAGQKPSTSALMGVDLGVPAVVASTLLPGELTVALGLAAPVQIHLSPEPTVAWQVLARLQAAKVIDGRWHALAGAEFGTTFYGPGAGSPTAEPLWRVHVGLAWH